MNENTRLNNILKKLEEHGYLSVAELSTHVFASQPTIRRDLIVLERKGLINRYHGGATLAKEYVPPLNARLGLMKREKQKIAKTAVSLIEEGNVVFIDTSSTALALIPYLSRIPNVLAVTNSLPAVSLLNNAEVRTVCTGGEYDKTAMGFIGHQAESIFNSIMVDVAFMSAPNINKDGIISDYSLGTTYVRQNVLQTCKKSVFLFDNSKFGKTATFRLATIDDFDYLVADFDFEKSFNSRVIKTTENEGVFFGSFKN